MPLANPKPATEFNTRGPFDNSQDYDTDDPCVSQRHVVCGT